MRNNPIYISLTILLFFTFTSVSCNNNKPLQTPKKPSVANSNSTKGNPKTTENPLKPIKSYILPKGSGNTKKIIIENKLIGTFSTDILDKHKNRIANIKHAAKKINNYILIPGATFSFNKVVGKRVTEKGYKKATILIKGERTEAIGGGICQLSSTLYNAVRKLNLKIVERHTHSADVHYLPMGLDAAVNYNNKDFKFINTKSYPLQLKINVNKNKLTVSIYNHKVTSSSTSSSSSSPSTTKQSNN